MIRIGTMVVRKVPFIFPMRREATSASTFTAKTAPWRKGDVVVIDAVSVMIDEHKPKTVHVGVTRDGTALYLESLVISANGSYFCTKAPIVIPSGYRVVVKCVSPTAGVVYDIVVFGHIEEYCQE